MVMYSYFSGSLYTISTSYTRPLVSSFPSSFYRVLVMSCAEATTDAETEWTALLLPDYSHEVSLIKNEIKTKLMSTTFLSNLFKCF